MPKSDLLLIARQLLQIAREEELSDVEKTRGDDDGLVILADALLRDRVARQDEFPESFFGEPAWDMLLHLFVEEGKGKSALVKHACLAANVPQTTAIRFIDLLECEGFVRRRPDVADRRRIFVELTTKGHDAMIRSLRRSARSLTVSSDLLR